MARETANSREQAKHYLSAHKIPQMFESLLSCLMLERPDDPVIYIEKKMAEIKEVGLENVNWETFVYHLHPYRDIVRRRHVHDGSKFDKEREIEETSKLEIERSKAVSRGSDYKPEVFQLTEAAQ
ncbi:Adenylate kinase isoenzyme 5 [Mizuhopecten yessoensis]|uniref:Adenylate kinase isoenzyme 5 n=1 Tax=Mizuhopecten yessoensis TaxID=6573 RepID=A0A210QI99_MIZYE|nr:Adenylate kinase isoenzyme 5 [Mizuhopecten yessoensis]